MYNNKAEGLTKEQILVYLRKSRADDALLTVEEVLKKHETILDEWCENNIGSTVDEGNKYREVVSGETIADRPEMQELLKQIESPRIKAVAVVEVQRLSRGDLEDAGRLIKTFRYTNTLVITPQRTYDLRDEYDRDYFERELKRGNEFLEYTKKIMNRGKIASFQAGNYVGSRAPYGYDKDTVMDGKRKCPTLKINEAEAEVVRLIFDLYVNKDYGRARIATYLDSLGIKAPSGAGWSVAGLADLLQNVHYIGKVKWNWRKTITKVENGEFIKSRPKTQIGEYLIVDGKHPAIITEELFNAAIEKRKRNHRAKAATKLINAYAGLVYCQHCGRSMVYRENKSQGTAPRLLCDKQTYCQQGSCTYDEMTEIVVKTLKECIEDFQIRIKDDNADSIKLHNSLITRLENKLAELEKKEIGMWDKYTEDGMPKHIFDTLNAKLLAEKEEVTAALCKAKESAPAPINYEERLHRFQNALDTLQSKDTSVEEKNRLLKSCIERIDYSRERPQRITGKKTHTEQRGCRWTTTPINVDIKLRV